MKNRLAVAIVIAAAAIGLVAPAAQAAVAGASATKLPNGGFEQGSLSGWGYRAVACEGIVASAGAGASGDSFFAPNWGVYGGSFSLDAPYGGAFIGAPSGDYAALFSQSGPSWGILHRGFKVPSKARSLNLDLLWVNQAIVASPIRAPGRSGAGASRGVSLEIGRWIRPTGSLRCPSSGLKQFAQVDLLRAGASPRSLKKKDILARIWQPLPGVTLANSGNWIQRRVSLKKFRGERVRLRVAAIDTAGFLNIGLDRVRIR